MEVLRFVWRGVLAFDRLGARFPQLAGVWLLELFVVLPAAFFVGKVVDVRGCCGVAGTGGGVDGVFWGCLVVALVAGFFAVRLWVRPKEVGLAWGGETYAVLTGHPSYALLQLLTVPIPLVMVLATRHHGDSTFYFRAVGWSGLVLIGVLALARTVVWYAAASRPPVTPRAAWEIAWKPVVGLVVLVLALGGVPFGALAWQEHRRIEALPVATAEAGEHPGQYYRVEGRVVGEPAYWAPRGTGRGGDNYAGVGVLVALDGGGEVLLLAESLSVPDLIGDLADVEDGRIRSLGRTIPEIEDYQQTYAGFDLADFPEPDPAGRVLILHSYP